MIDPDNLPDWLEPADPNSDPSVADLIELADDQLKLAAALGGENMSDREFLETMSTSDRLIDHEDNCGQCHHQWCLAEAARQLLSEGDILDGMKKWDLLSRRLWEDSKYFKLFKEETDAGRDPADAFQERGWDM